MVKIVILMGFISSLFGCHTPSIDPNDTITYFSYSKGGGMRRFDGYRYLVEQTKDGQVHFLFNEEYPDELDFVVDDHSVFDSLQQIVQKHKMYKYSGHYDPPFQVLDGQSWSLYVKYASGATISAGGYMAGPDGYHEAFEDVRTLLDPWKDTPVAVNQVVSFDYLYGTKHVHIDSREDHAEVTVDDETGDVHETFERPLEVMEKLRVMAVTEGMRKNADGTTDDPDSTPFRFELLFSNGDHYVYKSYDLKYKCHYTEVIHWFLENYEILDF